MLVRIGRGGDSVDGDSGPQGLGARGHPEAAAQAYGSSFAYWTWGIACYASCTIFSFAVMLLVLDICKLVMSKLTEQKDFTCTDLTSFKSTIVFLGVGLLGGGLLRWGIHHLFVEWNLYTKVEKYKGVFLVAKQIFDYAVNISLAVLYTRYPQVLKGRWRARLVGVTAGSIAIVSTVIRSSLHQGPTDAFGFVTSGMAAMAVLYASEGI